MVKINTTVSCNFVIQPLTICGPDNSLTPPAVDSAYHSGLASKVDGGSTRVYALICAVSLPSYPAALEPVNRYKTEVLDFRSFFIY